LNQYRANKKKVDQLMGERFIDNYLLFQLAIVSHNFSSEFHEFLRGKGMSLTPWRILINLIDSPGLHISELAKNTLLEQSHVTKTTDRLCNDGLVKKLIDEADRRRVIVSITNKGREKVEPLIEEAKKHEAEKLAQLNPDDAKQLKAILTTLAQPHIAKLHIK
jgi:DNA-binding MarR family transcriptional regulator